MYEPMADLSVLEWIAEDVEALADRSEGNGTLEVSACPGWVVDDLLAHVGGFLAGWYPYNLTHDPDAGDIAAAVSSALPVPEGNAELIAYLRTAGAEFVELARRSDLDATVWAFGGTAPARYWIHRAATEVAVHRCDVEASRGLRYRIPADRATMSCHETMCGFWPQARWLAAMMGAATPPDLPGGTFAMVAVDSGVAWQAKVLDDSVACEATEEPSADATVSGKAHDLAMWLWGRSAPDDVEIEGDRELALAWNLIDRAGM